MSEEYDAILALDVGSTTTKARLITRGDGGYQLEGRAEAPTTVEAPDEDVMVGVLESLSRLERRAGRQLLEEGRLITPTQRGQGVDVVVATSSAGGGLKMTVTGLMGALSGESSQRAALGAGAVVMDVISMDDGRLVLERIKRIQNLRPDIILIAGGTDGGNPSHVLAIAEYVAAAEPKPRWGEGYQLPVIFAGNSQARDLVARVLGDKVSISMVDNIRPTMEEEVLEPVRDEIHRLFLDHVMAHAPGYSQLLDMVHAPVIPTPAAVGGVLSDVAEHYGVNVVGVDIGGATTDVFSVFDGQFHRSVSANIGMSYSMGNVFVQARPEHITRWLPFSYSEDSLRDWHFNKMIRPTTLPETLDDLILEQAVAREAIRLSFAHHLSLAVELKGVKVNRSFDNALDQTGTGQPLVDPGRIDVIVGSGGAVSHAPRRSQAAMMMIDGIQPIGVCRLYVDNVFLLPHLGAVSKVSPEIAREVLFRDCLVPLGTCIAGSGSARKGRLLARLKLEPEEGPATDEEIRAGQIKVLPLEAGERVRVEIIPRGKSDFGAGPGKRLTAYVHGGAVGLILDGRGRPLEEQARRRTWRDVSEWSQAVDLYPQDVLARYQESLAEEVR